MAVKLNIRKPAKNDLDLECLDDILDLEDLEDVDADDGDTDLSDDDVELVDFNEDESDEDDEPDEPEPAPVRRRPANLGKSQTLRKKAKPIETAYDSDAIPEDSWEEFFFESCVDELADEEGEMDDCEGYYWRFSIYPEDADNFEKLRGLTTIDLIDPDGTGNSYHFRAY